MHDIKKVDFSLNEEFVNQIPGFFAIVNLESKFLCVSKMGSQWTGFASPDQMIGLGYANVKCRAAEDANLFLQHDQIVKHRGIFRFVGYYCYTGGDWKTIIGERYLLRNKQNEPAGIAIHFNDFTRSGLIDISRFLIHHNTRFHGINTKKQVIFSIEDCYSELCLSEKQSECLFFLLRGKTAKEIAVILQLSSRTVEDHLGEIKSKLKCRTKSEVIEKAIASGYMNIIPKNLIS